MKAPKALGQDDRKVTPAEIMAGSERVVRAATNQMALGVTQQNETKGLEFYPSVEWDGTQAFADGSGAITEYDPAYAGQNSTVEAGAFTADEGAEVDYWEEVALEDGSVCFYNHTSQEYSSELPAIEEAAQIDEDTEHPTDEGDKQPAGTAGSNNETELGMLEGQVWDGKDGEVFVPWPEEESQFIKASPDAGGPSNEQADTPEEEEDKEEPFMPDDPVVVREQNLRALLVLLPAKFMKGVVKAATEGAMLHTQRTATAEAERRRRLLLSSKAQFRQTMAKTPKVATPGQLVTTNSTRQGDGNEMGDTSDVDAEAVERADTPDSCRNTTTQERDIIVGDKLPEVLRVLYSTSKEEARLTMRAIYLSSQGIGAAGASQLAPALKRCVIVALHLGNNAMGDKGITALTDGLKHARGLQKLHLNDNEITDVGCRRLADALAPLKVLSTLDLCHNPFGDKACLSLATYLSQPGCPLRSLSLAGCLDVDPAAWKTIAVRGRGGMRWDPPRPGDDGAVSLAAALMCPHGCPLRRLRMANAGMKTIGAKAIAAALCANHTLETIDLSGNYFGCKADDNSWESASELLSFGLKVNKTVHTIVLRACGLSREQVLAIQENTVTQTARARKIHREIRQGVKPSELGGGCDKTGDCVGAGGDPLPWREEKRLGFRASCLRDWLLDAARVKGMRYPRPQSPDEGDTAAFAKKTSVGGQNKDGSPAATPEDSNQSEDQSVEWRLRTGLTSLQGVLASFEAGEPLPRGLGGVSGILASTSRLYGGDRDESLPSQEIGTRRDTLEANPAGKALDHSRRKRPYPQGIAEALTVRPDTTRPAIGENSENCGDQVSETPTISTAHSDIPASSRSQESSSSGSTNGAKTRSSSNEGSYSEEASNSGREGHGGIRSSQPNRASGSTINSDEVGENFSSHPVAFDGKDDGCAPVTEIPDEDAGQTRKPGKGKGANISPVMDQQERPLVRAVDLEAATQEGRRLAALAATACTDLQEKEAAVHSDILYLRQERDELRRRILEEASILEASLVNAGTTRDVASDSVRRLEPIATAARISEQAGRAELEEFRLTSGRRENGVKDPSADFVSMEQLENEWGERSRHAQALVEQLQEAKRHLVVAQRRVEELRMGGQSLQARNVDRDRTFRERLVEMSALVGGLRARRAALRRNEMALTALVVKLDKFAEAARKEEALRALVPAGSERRDLDLQVAEAVRLTSKVAQEVEEARLRREEAAIALEKARWGTAATMSSNGDDQILEVPAAAESLTRPKTVPTLSSSRSTSNQTKQEDEAMAGTGTAVKAAEDGGRGGVEEASRSESTEAENLRRLSEEYAKAKRDFVDALARRESAPVRRALALIRDHGDILRLKEKDTPEDADLNNILVQGRARRKRRPRGETPLLGVQLNAQIALGAKIALLRGSGEEDEEGNVILPEIDDRFLTVGQRLRRLRDARDGVEREKKRAYLEYSRQVKRNLRARKRFVLAEKRAGRIAQTMNTKQLVEALQERGYSTEGSETLDQLRRLFVDGIKPEMRVRLHATSRWTKSRNKHRERSNDAQVGDIAARRQRIRLPTGIAHPAFDNDKRGVGQDIRHAATV